MSRQSCFGINEPLGLKTQQTDVGRDTEHLRALRRSPDKARNLPSR